MEFICTQLNMTRLPDSGMIYEAVNQEYAVREQFIFCTADTATLFFAGTNLPDISRILTILNDSGGKYQPTGSMTPSLWQSTDAAAIFLQMVVGIDDHAGSLQDLHEQFRMAVDSRHAGPLLQRLFRQGILLHEKARQESGFFDYAIDVPAIVRELTSKVLGYPAHRQVGQLGEHQAFPRILEMFSQNDSQAAVAVKPGSPTDKQPSALMHTDILLIGRSADQEQIRLVMDACKKTRRGPLVVFDFSDRPLAAQFRKIGGVYLYEPSDLEKIRRLNLADRQKVTARIQRWISRELSNFDQWTSDSLHSFSGISGKSEAMQQVFEQIARVARSDATILIDGESGTGKEITAIAIHNLSHRSQHPFKTINCGAIPENLLESELFGHVRGAFTGAVANKPGLFETANSGTLFLDEIGEMPRHLQVKLLRFLQSGEIKRVGSNDTISVDVRVLAATNQNLQTMVDEGKFRSDLFYRLNVIQLTLPPLRDRREDILLLVQHFLKKFAARYRKNVQSLSDEAMELLHNHDWPGNVRELENIIERAVVLAVGDNISAAQLPAAIGSDGDDSFPLSSGMPLKLLEKHHILATLKACKNNYDLACKKLGIGRTTLWRKLREYQVDLDDEG